jgi:hypothetical protein
MKKKYRILVELVLDVSEGEAPKDVAEYVNEALTLHMRDAEEITVTPGVVEGEPFEKTVIAVKEELEYLVSLFEDESEENNALELYEPGISRIDDGVTWIAATAHAVQVLHDRAGEFAEAHKGRALVPLHAVQISPENVDSMPDEVLHNIAHHILHQQGNDDCSVHETMTREQLIEYIKQHMQPLAPSLN